MLKKAIYGLIFLSPMILYFFWFGIHLDGKLSDNNGDWGGFGSFISGVWGPTLSFVTILILIHTNSEQRKKDLLKRFEDRFYGMINYQRDFYNKNEIYFEGEKRSYYQLIKIFEEILFAEKNIARINTEVVSDVVYPLVRHFYLLLKSIDREYAAGNISKSDRDLYYEYLMNLTDFDLTRLIFFYLFTNQENSNRNSKYILQSKDFMKIVSELGLKEYIDDIENVMLNIKNIN